jgi:hypothetical protein
MKDSERECGCAGLILVEIDNDVVDLHAPLSSPL